MKVGNIFHRHVRYQLYCHVYTMLNVAICRSRQERPFSDYKGEFVFPTQE